MFSRWGAFVYRFRRPVAILAVVLAVASSVLAAQASSALSSGGWLDADSESAEVAARLDEDFGSGKSSMIALFRSDTPGADARGEAFQGAIAATTAGLADDPVVSGVVGYAETGDDRFISTAGDAAYVVIELTVTDEESVDAVDGIREGLVAARRLQLPADRLRPDHQGRRRTVREGPPEGRARVAARSPRSILVLVFASIVAAGMPLLVAGLAIPSTMALIFIVAQQVEMSIYVLNIATMLGLALAIDYSLFIVSRYREELRRGRTRRRGGRAGRRDVRQGGHVQRHRRRHRAVRPAPVRGAGHPLHRHRRVARRHQLGVLRPDLPAGDAGHARAARERPVAGRHLAAVPAGRRSAGRRADVALGARRHVGHAPPDPGHDPDRRPAADRRHPVRPHGPGRPGRRGLPTRRREPRRVRRPPDRVRPRRDDADRHPGRRRGLGPTDVATIDGRSTPTRAELDRASTASTGSRGRSRSPTRRPGSRSRRSRSPRSTPCPTASDPPGIDALPRPVRPREHDPARRPSARCRRHRRRRPTSSRSSAPSIRATASRPRSAARPPAATTSSCRRPSGRRTPSA